MWLPRISSFLLAIADLVKQQKDEASVAAAEEDMRAGSQEIQAAAAADKEEDISESPASAAGPLSKSQLDHLLRAKKMKRINKKKNSRNRNGAWF
jgi:hypothetical protein